MALSAHAWHRYRRFAGFTGVSGLGWLIDLSLLLMLTAGAGIAPFAANTVSSLTAAAFVFLCTRRVVFVAGRGRTTLRLAGYLAYTMLLILAASAALQAIAGLFDALPAAASTVIAKIAVTPPQLALNFLVARHLVERVGG